MEAPRFESTGWMQSFDVETTMLSHVGTVSMRASDLHTVYVPPGETAAWVVAEGAEDPAYRPVTYSDDKLENFDFAGLYEPASDEFVALKLAHALRCSSFANVQATCGAARHLPDMVAALDEYVQLALASARMGAKT